MSSGPSGGNPRRPPQAPPQRPKISEGDLRKFETYVSEIFTALGLDFKTPGTGATSHRFIPALIDSKEGYAGDAKLLTAFGAECRGGKDCELNQIVGGPIPFFALCEHHVLPFYGGVYVGYIAHEEIIRLSKLTPLVRLFSRRFTVWERIGQQVVDTLESFLAAHAVAVVLEAHQLFTRMRGVRESGPTTRTTFWRGRYTVNSSLRAEFLTLCGVRG